MGGRVRDGNVLACTGVHQRGWRAAVADMEAVCGGVPQARADTMKAVTSKRLGLCGESAEKQKKNTFRGALNGLKRPCHSVAVMDR